MQTFLDDLITKNRVEFEWMKEEAPDCQNTTKKNNKSMQDQNMKDKNKEDKRNEVSFDIVLDKNSNSSIENSQQYHNGNLV